MKKHTWDKDILVEIKNEKQVFNLKKFSTGMASVLVCSIISLYIPPTEFSLFSTGGIVEAEELNSSVYINLKPEYVSGSVLYASSMDAVNPEKYIVFPEGYKVDYYFKSPNSNEYYFNDNIVESKRINGITTIKYTLKGLDGSNVYYDSGPNKGQLVTVNVNVHIYDETDLVKKINEEKEKIDSNPKYVNGVEVKKELDDLVINVNTPPTTQKDINDYISSIPNIIAKLKERKTTAEVTDPTVEKLVVKQG
ncbi:TPA: hypothetical protein ACGBG5_003048, partial [Enterococcus faecalis]